MSSLQTFKITDYVEFNSSGRAECPACVQSKGYDKKKNLSLVPGTDGAYKCHANCSPEDIRAALGASKPQQIPAALAQPKANTTISPQKVREAHDLLMGGAGASRPARQWLNERGITEALMQRHQLGISRAKVTTKDGDRHLAAITIPIPNDDGTAYWQKKRVAPWFSAESLEAMPDYKPWSQFGVPARVWFTWLPAEATETWLCEGEWDAILLGAQVRNADLPIAVASFTCGANAVPPREQLDLLPGTVTIWYDRNDKPNKKGERPGEVGAKKVAAALGDRARIALVPMPQDCQIHGWDVTDALRGGFKPEDFTAAAKAAVTVKKAETQALKSENPLRSRMVSTDELIARAPEFVEWLIPDILTTDELFVLGSPPRGGKSLMCMLLAKSIATGQPFLDRPVQKGSVLYVNLEDSEAKVRERVEAQQWSEGLPVYWIDKFKLEETDHLIEVAQDMPGLKLIILDTLSRIRSNDVSESAAEMSQVLEPLQEFAKRQKVCILLVHHTRKLTVQEDTIDVLFDSLRGSSAIRGTCRGMLIIAPSANETYRLAIENGWGKHDLKIRLEVQSLEWQLLGKWSPLINIAQKDLALDFLNKVGSATLDTISEQTGIPKRGLHVVLDRLRRDGMVEKTGSQRSAVYQRPVQQVQQLNSLLNSSNADAVSDIGVVQQKNNIFSYPDQREPDHSTHADIDQVEPMITFSEKVLFVEQGDKQTSNADAVSNTAVQQQFNNSSTVELRAQPDQSLPVPRRELKNIQCKHCGFPARGCEAYSYYKGLGFTQTICNCVEQAVEQPLKPGDRVVYIGKNPAMAQVCGAKRLEILSLFGDGAEVKHSRWLVTQTIPLNELKRVGVSHANG
jgi:hypothetical protein